MNTVCENGKCTGCMECIDICPKNAIRVVDSWTKYDAIIDSDKCIKCNACHRACQNNNKIMLTKPIYWKQGWASDDSIRMKSSSGGIATAIEQAFVKNGGVVCSCVFRFGKFGFEFAETENEVGKFAGSKYVKSNPQGIYKEILKKLKTGEKVLFVGLPCQVAAVKQFTQDHKNLYTIDLICHGTPSPHILDSFLIDHGVQLAEIQSIRFREKDNFKLEQNGKRFAIPITTDDYIMTFLNSTTYTENCYQCKYARIERIGDITLGDSWGSELEKYIQDKGVSLMLCQNEKGKDLIKQSDLTLVAVDLERAIESNHQLHKPSQKPKQRELFLKELKKGYGFERTVRRCYPKKWLRNIMKTLLYKMKFIGGAEPLSSNSCYCGKRQYKINIPIVGEICALLRFDAKINSARSIVRNCLWKTATIKCLAFHKLKFVNLKSRILLTC